MDNMAEKKYQVFVSSTYEDLRDYRREAVDTILRLGHLPIGMELFNAASQPPWEIIKNHIDNSDYYIVILAHRYGSLLDDGSGISYTEKEYDYARSKNIPCLGFIIDKETSWPPHYSDNKRNKLESFKNKLQKQLVTYWKNPSELSRKISEALSQEFKKKERPGWVRGSLPSPFPSSNEQLLKVAIGAIENDNLLHFLKWQYASEPILERGGCTYPVAVYPAPKTQWERIDSVLVSPLHTHKQAHYVVNDSTFLDLIRSLQNGGFTLHNDISTPNYTMRSLTVNGELALECGLGDYFSSYRTSEALEWEIRSNIEKLAGSNEEAFNYFLRQLPLRRDLHNSLPSTSSPARNGSGRSASIGISTLIAYKESSEATTPYQLLMRRRAKKGVPLRSGLLHVLPGFMFQPMTDIHREYSIVHNVYREYLEELFGAPEIFNGPDPNYFYSDERLQYLQSLMNDCQAKLYFTGIGVNLLNLRPEICTLLVISTPEWYKKGDKEPEHRWKINEEFTHIREGVAPAGEFVGSFSLDNDLEMIKKASIYPDRTVPAGAAAFWLGVDTLRELLKDPS